MMNLKRSVLIMLFVMAVSVSCNANAQLYVVINNTNPMNSISSGTLKRIYLGKIVPIPGSNTALYPVDLPSRSPAKSEFLEKVMRMKASLLMQYRSRQIFSGKGRIPITAASNSAVESIVARRTNAIGYMSIAPDPTKVKVILTI